VTWTPPSFDKHAWEGKRSHAVSSTTGIAFSDFMRMHVSRRETVQDRRLPTPPWSIRDEWLQQLLVIYLEKRFYVQPVDYTATLRQRMETARLAAEHRAPAKMEDLNNWIDDHHKITMYGYTPEKYSDDEAIALFISLKHIGGQLPISADYARDYLANKRLHDLAIQIQNIDTDLVLTKKGHAGIVAAIIYLFYRMGYDSVEVAELLGLKPPHVRQVLARLHSTWEEHLSHLEGVSEGGKDAIANPQGAEVQGCAPSSTPLDAIFAEGA
jgi:hypothetical protein